MVRRLSQFLFFIFVTICAALGRESETPFHVVLTPEQRAHILDGDFSIVDTVEHLPAEVQKGLATIFRQNRFEMANPGQLYQATDVGQNGPLRRLVFAGLSKERCFVHYERGGRGHGYYVIVFQIDSGGRAKFKWAGASSKDAPASDLLQLRSEVSAGRFKDKELYSW